MAKLVTVRLFLAVVTANGWAIHQMDINNAHLHGEIKEDIYMLPPLGYDKTKKKKKKKMRYANLSSAYMALNKLEGNGIKYSQLLLLLLGLLNLLLTTVYLQN